jgi:hypothetical protein
VSPTILEASATVSTTFGVPQRNLNALTEKLASLRYLIILTARWEGSEGIRQDHRKIMNRDLARLRREYSLLIDDIAMNFGIQPAMEAKDGVERNVTVPKDIKPPEGREYEDSFSI